MTKSRLPSLKNSSFFSRFFFFFHQTNYPFSPYLATTVLYVHMLHHIILWKCSSSTFGSKKQICLPFSTNTRYSIQYMLTHDDPYAFKMVIAVDMGVCGIWLYAQKSPHNDWRPLNSLTNCTMNRCFWSSAPSHIPAHWNVTRLSNPIFYSSVFYSKNFECVQGKEKK